jgi:uncharacterized protein (TIGR03083 family)
MQPLPAERYYAELAASTSVLAALIESADPGLPIPTCPEWNIRQLATHVGRAQRWAAEIVSTRANDVIPFRSVPDGAFPKERAEQAPWLLAGPGRLVSAVQQAGDDRVWAFGFQLPATFWARRMCHETMVHRVDAELAAGRPPALVPDLAADAIDEWLDLQTARLPEQSDEAEGALPPGRSLHLHATDDGIAGEWVVANGPGGVTVRPGHERADAAVAGPAAAVLLVLLRRRPADDPAVTVHGDRSVLEHWLAHTPF